MTNIYMSVWCSNEYYDDPPNMVHVRVSDELKDKVKTFVDIMKEHDIYKITEFFYSCSYYATWNLDHGSMEAFTPECLEGNDPERMDVTTFQLVNIGGKTIYHAGDTGLFLDMQLIGEMNDIDLAILPIGDNFTMGPEDAAKAVEFLKPKKIIPMHYNTFDVINQDVSKFVDMVKGLSAECVAIEYGSSIEI